MGATYRGSFPAAGSAVRSPTTRRKYRGGANGGAPPGPSYDADAQAWFAAVGWGNTELARKDAVNQFYLDLKAAALYDKFDRLWLFANIDGAAALRCLKSLSVATAVNSPTFTQWEGYVGDGSTSYVNVGFNPTLHGVQFALNSASVVAYSRINTAPAVPRDMGGNGGGGGSSTLLFRFDDGSAYTNINTGAISFATAVVANSVGLYMGTRTASNAQALYKDGVSIATSADASTSLPNVAMYIGCRNDNGAAAGFSNRQIAFSALGAGFSSLEAAAFKTCFDTLKSGVGF